VFLRVKAPRSVALFVDETPLPSRPNATGPPARAAILPSATLLPYPQPVSAIVPA
jgi:hypothetical protein